jgi:hypothetical protein
MFFLKSTVVLAVMVVSMQLKSQHIVQVKSANGQMLTLSGDSTKFSFKANVAFYEGDYEKAATLKLQSITSKETKDIGVSYYDIACYYSLAGISDKGLKYLILSFENGYEDIANSLFDGDLEYLRKDEKWEEIVNGHLEKYFLINNKKIALMYGEDQNARLSGNPDWTKLEKEDSIRRIQIMELIESNQIKSPHDYYKTAMIMHHSTDPEDSKIAHELALMSLVFEEKHQMAPWLAAATKDRYLLNSGKKQWFGTQGLQFLTQNSKLGLDPAKIDTAAVANELRTRWNVPSIEKIREYLKNWEEANNKH